MIRYEDQGPYRLLFAGKISRAMQGAMHRENTTAIVVEYALSMMAWLLLADAAKLPELHAMQLGLGPGMLTKFCHNKLGMRTTAVEIDPAMVAACRDWFVLPPNGEKLQVLVGDAAIEIAKPERQGSVDVLQVDLFDAESQQPALDTVEFWSACKASLTHDGCMTVNLFGDTGNYSPWESVERIRQVFSTASVWILTPANQANLVVLARNRLLPADIGALVEHAQLLDERYQLPASALLQQLQCPLPG